MENTNAMIPATTESGLQLTEVQKIFANAPAALTSNRGSKNKAFEAADHLIANAKQVGMSETLDQQMSVFVEKGRKTVTAMNDRRKPFTQMMDAVKKEFTTQETELKAKIEEIQVIRNDYATQKMEELRAKEEAARRELAKKQEVISIRQAFDKGIAEGYAEHLQESKMILLEKFNAATLDNISEVFGEINSYPVTLSPEIYRTFAPVVPVQYHAPEEIDTIRRASLNGSYKANSEDYERNIKVLKKELLDKYTSQKNALEMLAKADEAEQERIRQEQKKREETERERVRKESEEAKQKAAAQADAEAAAANAKAEINAAVMMGSTADVKEGFSIILQDASANLLLANFWMVNEGKSLPQEKIDKMTFERIRKWCEKHALDTGEMIDSPYVEYKPVYKAK